MVTCQWIIEIEFEWSPRNHGLTTRSVLSSSGWPLSEISCNHAEGNMYSSLSQEQGLSLSWNSTQTNRSWIWFLKSWNAPGRSVRQIHRTDYQNKWSNHLSNLTQHSKIDVINKIYFLVRLWNRLIKGKTYCKILNRDVLLRLSFHDAGLPTSAFTCSLRCHIRHNIGCLFLARRFRPIILNMTGRDLGPLSTVHTCRSM